MSRRGTAPAKLARLCSKKFRIGSRAMAVCTKTHEDKTSSRPRGLAGTLWNGRFSTTGCVLDVEDFRKTRPARRTQADAPEAVFGHSKKFNPLLPACKRTAHPDQEQPIQSRQEQSRKVMAAGAPGQEDVNQPERFSGLQRTVGLGSCQALGCTRRRVLGVLQACWRGLLAGTAGSGSRHGLRDPAVSSGIRDRATQACREMRQPGNTVAHRLCASSLWAIGKLADWKKPSVINDLRMQGNAVATGRCLFFACFPQGPAQRAGRRCKAKGGRPLSSCWP